jgi:molybdopterin synthase catalytic subunit
MVGLTKKPINPTELLKLVQRPNCGGTVLFVGTVRDLTGDQVTVALEYEAYSSMAESMMAEIEKDVRTKWNIGDIAMVHRMGRLEISDVAVAVAVSTPHRADAFVACQYAIDQVKKLVPIWKCEHAPDGKSEWVHPS